MTKQPYAIKITKLSKTFKIPHERYSSLKQSAVNLKNHVAMFSFKPSRSLI